MSQSFHAGVSATAHRRRTDLMPTITASTPTGSNVGTRASSRIDGSRSSTPGHKMLRSANAGRTVSMSRLETLSRPRVLVIPHASSNAAAPPKSSSPRSRFSPAKSASKSVSMVHLNGPPMSVRRPSDDSANDASTARSFKTRSVASKNGKSVCSVKGQATAYKDVFCSANYCYIKGY